MINEKKVKTIAEDKWERKKYLLECDSDKTKDVIRIIPHKWQTDCNYERDNADKKYSLKNQETPQSMCWNVKKLPSSHLVKKTAREFWKEITGIYR